MTRLADIDERGSLGFRPCEACTRTNCVDVCPHFPVTYCSTECASHRCTRPCGRVTEHPADEAGHICDDCASAIAGWF